MPYSDTQSVVHKFSSLVWIMPLHYANNQTLCSMQYLTTVLLATPNVYLSLNALTTNKKRRQLCKLVLLKHTFYAVN